MKFRRRAEIDPQDSFTCSSLTGPFDRKRFDRQRGLDRLINQAFLIIAILAIGLALGLPLLGLSGMWVVSSLLAPLALLGAWLVLTQTTAQVGRSLAMIAVLVERDPGSAEQAIHKALERYPVMRWARLLTYHRLATLRHRQRRFEEAGELCFAVLSEPLRGPAASARAHLLLMLAECKLETGDLPGAYHALDTLFRARLSLVEALQRLALQTRYELMVNAPDAAIRAGQHKIELAELMPPPQCGVMHAMLAYAAQRTDQPRVAAWLWERARMITPPTLLEQFERGAFSVGVVEAAEPG
ncbi:MAG: hypothetical protein AAGC44_14270 [Planctomycetota bacterium]